MERDDRGVFLLAPEAAAGLRLDHARLAVVHRQPALERRVDVVRALERPVHVDAAALARHGDHRVVLDVQLLLVTDPVFALDDRVGGGERPIRIARTDLVGREDMLRFERIEDGRQWFGSHGQGVPGGPQGGPIRRRQQRQRLGVVLDLALDRDQDRLVGLDRAHHVVARDIRGRHDHDRRPVERRVQVESHEAGMGIGRPDRGPEPGAREDQVVGVLGRAGQLGRALASKRCRAARPARHDRPGLDHDGVGRGGARGQIGHGPSSMATDSITGVGRRGLAQSRPNREPATRGRPGMFAIGDDERARDDDLLDADRVRTRQVVRGGRTDRRRIEDHEVRHRAITDHAAIAQPEPRGRGRGHLADRFLERQERLVTDELAEDPREAAIRSRAGLLAEERAVRADHPDRVGHELRQRLGRRATGDLADPEVLGQEQVADHVERVVTGLGHHVGHGPALPAQVLGAVEGAEPDVGPAGGTGVGGATGRELGTDPVTGCAVGQALLERPRATGLDPERELDQQPRRGPLGRIGIERDVEPGRPRVVDQRQHRLRTARVRVAVIEVGDVRRGAGQAPDLDRLAERVQVAVTERIAHVRVVEATEAPGFRGQRPRAPRSWRSRPVDSRARS